MSFSISASQISTFRSCQRKWAWQKIAKIQAPQHASAALGTKMHSQLERYLKGEPPDTSTPEMRMITAIAYSGVEHIPKPNTPGMLLEEHFTFVLPASPEITYQGFIDVLLPGNVPMVLDHKSTSDFRYAKTEDDLRKDPQAVIYAYQATTKYSAPAVDLRWVYYRTRGSNASKRVHLRMSADQVRQEIDRVHSTSVEMVAIFRGNTDPLSLPATLDACGAYGGCPYKMNCTDLHCGPMGHLTEEEKANMTQSGTDLFKRLAAANGTPAPTLVATPVQTQAVLPAPMVQLPLTNTMPINPPESLLPPPPPEEPKAKKTKAAPKKSADKPAFVLYVDCAPVQPNEGTIDASAFFAVAKALVCKEFSVADFRQVDYGKGQGAFVSAVGFAVAEEVPEAIVLDSRTPEGILVLADLSSKASRIVRSFR